MNSVTNISAALVHLPGTRSGEGKQKSLTAGPALLPGQTVEYDFDAFAARKPSSAAMMRTYLDVKPAGSAQPTAAPNEYAGLTPAEAKDLVELESDVNELEEWLRGENRKSVRDAILKRIRTLKAG